MTRSEIKWSSSHRPAGRWYAAAVVFLLAGPVTDGLAQPGAPAPGMSSAAPQATWPGPSQPYVNQQAVSPEGHGGSLLRSPSPVPPYAPVSRPPYGYYDPSSAARMAMPGAGTNNVWTRGQTGSAPGSIPPSVAGGIAGGAPDYHDPRYSAPTAPPSVGLYPSTGYEPAFAHGPSATPSTTGGYATSGEVGPPYGQPASIPPGLAGSQPAALPPGFGDAPYGGTDRPAAESMMQPPSDRGVHGMTPPASTATPSPGYGRFASGMGHPDTVPSGVGAPPSVAGGNGAPSPDPRLASSRPVQPFDGTGLHGQVLENSAPALHGVAALLALRQAPNEHPLMPLIRWAESERSRIENIQDYQGILVKQENINGRVEEAEHIFVKIRHKPFSVYLYFLKPDNKKGQEALFVQGQNNNMLKARGVGWEGAFGTQDLDPNGWLARRGNKYPITDIGILNLVDKFVETGRKDSKYGECSVRIEPQAARINGRSCTRIQVIHPHPRPQFMFHRADIFIDEELNLPIRYEAYDWPKRPGETPPLLEAYTYLELQLNVGLTDADFDPRNSNYRFYGK